MVGAFAWAPLQAASLGHINSTRVGMLAPGKARDTSTRACVRRRISAGEEITVDYLINNPGGDSWPCQCGAARCRGMTGTSFFDLPVRFQREYFPLLAPWFKQRFAKQMAQLEPTL